MTPLLPEFDEWLDNALVEEAAMAGESVETYIARAAAGRMVIERARRGDADIQELLARVRAANLDVPGPIAGDSVLSDPDRLRALYDSGLLNAERARSLDSEALIKALEGHSYRLLKDQQQWRAFDHQNVQSVYAVRVKPRAEVMKDALRQDYFEIVHQLDGAQAAPSLAEWQAERQAAGQPSTLQ